MKGLFGILILSLTILTSFTSIEVSDEWEFYKEIDGIKIYTKTSDCELSRGYDERRILLKLENTTQIDKTIEWDILLWYNDRCKTCKITSGEYHRKTFVKAESSLEGECSITTNFDLVIFVEFIDEQYKGNKQILTRFELYNLKVTQ